MAGSWSSTAARRERIGPLPEAGEGQSLGRSEDMWRNYMTVGVRALVKNKTYAFINIFGLGVGLAACLMLLLYVRYETTYDQFLPNAENSFQFQTHYLDKQTGRTFDGQMTAYVSGQRLRNDFPQVDRMVYALEAEPVIERGG